MGMKMTMKKEKIVIKLNTETIQKLKERSTKEGKTISSIIEDALLNFCYTVPASTEIRRAAALRFCSKPFNLNIKELKNLLNY
jgi:ATP-dependent protease Clp ATPase subunit